MKQTGVLFKQLMREASVRGDRYHDGGAGRMAHVRCVR